MASVRTAPPPLPLLEKKLEKAVAVTGRSTVPVPIKSEKSEGASAAVSPSENDCVVIVGGMKLGFVIGSIDDQVPLDSVICTKSTGCLVAGPPKICVVPSGPKSVTLGPSVNDALLDGSESTFGSVVCDVARSMVVGTCVLTKTSV